ncbi:hypothetical protein BCR34DRAFT_294929 [Clohesyomyces aquaticus]|uniref:Uncharacterized protein n=1 Tax=Clohesyomyces aquaticus TaxID=1231657 RepID=A0A1Y2A8G3_9PLEO|nr:hypothetical protein BCR34DRAFT_294929 [Clohesyomyces aquaticus]
MFHSEGGPIRIYSRSGARSRARSRSHVFQLLAARPKLIIVSITSVFLFYPCFTAFSASSDTSTDPAAKVQDVKRYRMVVLPWHRPLRLVSHSGRKCLSRGRDACFTDLESSFRSDEDSWYSRMHRENASAATCAIGEHGADLLSCRASLR